MKNDLRQIIPQDFCLECKGCCRFIDDKSEWIPQITDSEILEAVKKGVPAGAFSKTDKNNHHLAVVKKDDAIICEFLSKQTNKCQIYATRPFDCEIYPFILEKRDNKIYLSLHSECPFVRENIDKKEYKEYIEYFKKLIKQKDISSFIQENIFLAGNYEKYQNQIKTICILE